MAEKVDIRIGSKSHEFPVIVGTEGEKGIDVNELRSRTGYITYDPSYANTGSCKSAITFIDGEKGILRYRGIPIEQLAEKSRFVETVYLLIHGDLPTKKQLDVFSQGLTDNAALHEDFWHFFNGFSITTHPMAIMSSMICALSGFHPVKSDIEENEEEFLATAVRLISKVRTVAAYTYKKSRGQPFIYPKRNLRYCANFLHMMFSLPYEDYHVDPVAERALNVLWILHADHEQNCSTSTVRLVGSSRTNLFASVAAAICSLWGPWHGGANQEVMEMLESIYQSGVSVDKYIEEAKNPNSPRRLAGFGHRIYKTYDPRAKIIKEHCHKVIKKFGTADPLLDIAMKLEEKVLKDDYFVSRKLFPNVDFYSGIIYKALGIPTDMFTVMFAIGRLPGWIAHWKEMRLTKPSKIGRPRQIYVGETERDYVPMDKRG